MVCLTDARQLKQKSIANVIDWRSSKSKRVVRSTLAAETQAIDDATDHAAPAPTDDAGA